MPETYTTTVADDHDRIIWRGHYYALPLRALPPRETLAQFIEAQMDNTINPPKDAHHYGYVELRALLDMLYDGPPQRKEEEISRRINRME